MKFLSQEWYQAANEALQGLQIENLDLTVAYVSETSAHHIVIAEGKASVRPGTIGAHVTLRQSADITRELREGSLSALTAIQEGRIAVEGDVSRLLASQGVLAAIDDVLLSVITED